MFGLVLIAVPRLQKLPLAWLLAIPVPTVLGLKAWLGYGIAGEHLPLSVTELCAVGLTVLLARQIAESLKAYSQSVRDALLGRLDGRSQPFANGQAEMYRELRRARSFQRPVAMLAVAPEKAGDKAVLDRFIAELERQTVQEYVSAQVAELLTDHLKDYDIVVRRDGHFLTLLPEVDRRQAAEIAEKLTASAWEKLGLNLKIGLSVFPEEEVTLVGMLDRAEAALGNGHARGTPHFGNGRSKGEAQLVTVGAVSSAEAGVNPSPEPLQEVPARGGDQFAQEKQTRPDRPR
jgi:GGDEF domain-containing protein